MAKGIDLLRTYYSELTPFERINMLTREVTTWQRDDLIQALAPPTVNTAWKGSVIHASYLMIAAYAVIQSLIAGRKCFALLATAETINKLCKQYKDAFEESARALEDAEAWITALARLEKMTGAALLDTARFFARKHVDNMREQAKKSSSETPEAPSNDLVQFQVLCDMWHLVEKDILAG